MPGQTTGILIIKMVLVSDEGFRVNRSSLRYPLPVSEASRFSSPSLMVTAPSGICSSCRTITVMGEVTNREAEVFVVCDNLEIILQSLFLKLVVVFSNEHVEF